MDETLIFGIVLALVAAYFILEELSGGEANPGDTQNVTSNGAESILDSDAITSYAQNAGFSGDDLNIAVAVAMAESSGNVNAYNPEVQAGAAENMGSFGLWQIYLTAHPEFAGENLYDPQTNANAAFAIYSAAGNSFRPWSTYKSGAYEGYLTASSDETANTVGEDESTDLPGYGEDASVFDDSDDDSEG